MDLACRKLHEAHGRPPLLVMPPEYMNEVTVPNHTSSNPANQAREQEVTPAERAYMRAWRAGGVGLWVCPEGTSDDWYWMNATVVAGADARVLSNDEMRDHAFQMLPAPALFRKWKERHQVRFHMSKGSGLELFFPPAFSHCAQNATDDAWWMIPKDDGSWLCAVKSERETA